MRKFLLPLGLCLACHLAGAGNLALEPGPEFEIALQVAGP